MTSPEGKKAAKLASEAVAASESARAAVEAAAEQTGSAGQPSGTASVQSSAPTGAEPGSSFVAGISEDTRKSFDARKPTAIEKKVDEADQDDADKKIERDVDEDHFCWLGC